MLKLIPLTLMAWAGLAVGAQAQSLAGFTGEASLNGSATTGNTKTTDVGFGLKLSNDTGTWRHTVTASTDYGRADGNTNKKRYALGYKIDRDINDRLYGYANADYFSDDFGAFKQGYFIGTGLGYEVLNEVPATWRLEAGVGYRSQKARLALNNATGFPSSKENELAGRLFSDFDYALNDNVSLYNDTEVLYSASDTFITNETGITSQLWENLAMRASFRVENHSDVPLGRKKTDTISRIGIVYTMK